ncbi:rRNA-processing protein UTP23 homolog [Condylostylus longicornis]|uniref:rRNA-processing protein UTP23 homolog n=1 Tax=Condylostylus longicornis TaxID=2530218 RepID=UPI00244E4253|nr:rRNA-processing protein UTP23 homolog [Condylostylus longicornis]
MKIERLKKSHKTMAFYITNFNYHQPYQVLVDATFCQAALKNKVQINDQLKKYLQSELKLLTTYCCILEAESLGASLSGATQIVKKFAVHKCGHEGKPVPASECIYSMVKSSKYIISTQDRDLQEKLRRLAGQAIIYLHKATPVLEQPSKASKKFVNRIKMRSLLSKQTEQKIKVFKEIEGINKELNVTKIMNKKKKPRGPNPLSCKKKTIKKTGPSRPSRKKKKK